MPAKHCLSGQKIATFSPCIRMENVLYMQVVLLLWQHLQNAHTTRI